VIAANGDGVWNTRGAALRIVVVPPFWRTWWFLTLALLAGGGLAAFTYRHHVAKLQLAHAAQEEFSRRLITSQERERQRIAAELHDSLGQNLLIIKNRALFGALTEDLAEAKKQFDEITAATTHAIEEVRQISYNLRPHHLDSLGLSHSLEVMLENVESSSGIGFSYDIAPLDGVLSKEREINLYRIVQEAINNIVKHSGATRARVEVARDERTLHVTIRDNGRGFVPKTYTTGELRQRGFGLTGIAERVRMLGGTQVFNSVPGEGTTVTITLGLQNLTEDGRHAS
jgi:signal transduction histidine kinase